MIVPIVRVQSRAPGFEKKSLVVIGFQLNDLDVFKVHVVAGMVDMACAPQFGSLMTFLFGHSTQNYTVQLILYTVPDFWRSESCSSLGRGKGS